MKSLVSIAVISATLLMHGCATTHSGSEGLAAGTEGLTARPAGNFANDESPIVLAPEGKLAANGAALGETKDAPVVDGHPMTAVVVTQCNLVVAVYMTMDDGRLLRFDKKANLPAEQLVAMAYTATRSERVEVSCDGTGVAGYETHIPT